MNLSIIDLNKLFVPDFPYQSVQTIYDALLGQFIVTINYNVSLNSYSNLKLVFRLPFDANFTSTIDYDIVLKSQTDNNLALKFYTPEAYSRLKSLTDSS